jgi:tRNA G37 N-methylase Trm5
MLAQKMKSQIHGIEIDLSTFKQLKENLARSGWKGKLRAFVGDARIMPFPAPTISSFAIRRFIPVT